jgi:hypothetical protein
MDMQLCYSSNNKVKEARRVEPVHWRVEGARVSSCRFHVIFVPENKGIRVLFERLRVLFTLTLSLGVVNYKTETET